MLVSIVVRTVATVLTACGIETLMLLFRLAAPPGLVATVLTACGIETIIDIEVGPYFFNWYSCNSAYRLRYWNSLNIRKEYITWFLPCCNSAYRLRYWNCGWTSSQCTPNTSCCNSAYRLRYWNNPFGSSDIAKIVELQQCLPLAVCINWIVLTPEWIILICSGVLYLSFLEYIHSHLFYILKM